MAPGRLLEKQLPDDKQPSEEDDNIEVDKDE